MARIRTIKPEFPQSESMGRISREARLLFILLWTFVDDSGRSRASSRLLASLLYPYDDDAASHLSGWLQELHDEGCIILYHAEGNDYLQVTHWAKHQKIDKPTGSKIPSPPQNSRGFSTIREDSRGLGEDSTTDLGKDLGIGEDLGRDQKGARREDSRGFAPIELVEVFVSSVPDDWQTSEFREEVTKFVEMQHRKFARQAWDPVQIRQNVAHWLDSGFGLEEAIAAIQEASLAGWKLVKVTRSKPAKGRPLQSEALGEALKEIRHEDQQKAIAGGAR